MVVDEMTAEDVDRIFQALAHQVRRDILRRTMRSSASVSELAASYDMSFAAVQKHVAVLDRAALITKQSRGRICVIRGNPETLVRAQQLLSEYEQIWRSRISRMDALFAEEDE